MTKILLKELGMLGIVLGLTMEAPAFADDSQSDADMPDQQSTTTVQESDAADAATEGDVHQKLGGNESESEGDTDGGMVKQDKANFGSGGEAMPGTDLPKRSEASSDNTSEQQTDNDE